MINSLLSQNNVQLLLRLIVAHLFTDFLFQMDFLWGQRFKKNWFSPRLYVHGVLAGVLAYIFAGFWHVIWLPLVIFITHVLFDGFKFKATDTVFSFLLDQLGHLIVIIGCWIFLANVNIPEIIRPFVFMISSVKSWILILSYMTIIWPAGIVIGKITEPWRKQINQESCVGLAKAGLWIGRLERILILTFVLLNRFEAVGFLIAAKSIFRFGEISSPDRRKEAEYILIGTLISFVAAIIFGIFTRWILQYVSAS